MQTEHKPDGGRGASLSRRGFLHAATLAASSAGIAATLPSVAVAGGSADLRTLPLTDEQQLEACIGQLRNILQRMHPGFDDVRGGYYAHPNGGASVMIDLHRKPEKWTEPGLYLVDYGTLKRVEAEFFITCEWSDMERQHLLWGGLYLDGKVYGPREIINPDRIIRKLKGGAI